MKIFKLNNKNTGYCADEAAKVISRGGIAILPFDTVYGFACDPRLDDTLKRIFYLKKRPLTQTIGLATYKTEKIVEVVDLSSERLALINKKVPGPYSFILKLKESKSEFFSTYCQKDGNVLIRIPDSKIVNQITRDELPFIAQTSANLHGESDCYSVPELFSQYDNEAVRDIDLIVDGGKIESFGSSTIINLALDKPSEIERKRKN